MLQIWDTAGQERFDAVNGRSYRDKHALIMCYDISNRTSFEALPKRLANARKCWQDVNGYSPVIVIAGLKEDRRDEHEQVGSQ
jgi:GTPase SAR1 family protein